MERTTVRLPPDLLSRARKKAAAEGKTLTSLIEEGLRIVVFAARGRTPPAERKLPRVSKATGGLRPGVTFDRLSDIDEMDDVEYVERMKSFK